MKRWDSLRGHGVINQLYAQGNRLDAELVRCVYTFARGVSPGVRVAFAVPSKTFNAVRRNRLKRLMREAFAREWQILHRDSEQARISASLLFIVKGRKRILSTRTTLDSIHQSIASLCTTLRTQM